MANGCWLIAKVIAQKQTWVDLFLLVNTLLAGRDQPDKHCLSAISCWIWLWCSWWMCELVHVGVWCFWWSLFLEHVRHCAPGETPENLMSKVCCPAKCTALSFVWTCYIESREFQGSDLSHTCAQLASQLIQKQMSPQNHNSTIFSKCHFKTFTKKWSAMQAHIKETTKWQTMLAPHAPTLIPCDSEWQGCGILKFEFSKPLSAQNEPFLLTLLSHATCSQKHWKGAAMLLRNNFLKYFFL